MNYETSEQYKMWKPGNSVIGGFFILMGTIFFLGMSEVTILGKSPWLLVALLPVYWIGVMAYKRYQQEGRVSRHVFSMLVFGLLPFAYIAAAFLGFNMAAIWPIGLIAVGVSYLLFGINK
jgi:hypothetical protein